MLLFSGRVKVIQARFVIINVLIHSHIQKIKSGLFGGLAGRNIFVQNGGDYFLFTIVIEKEIKISFYRLCSISFLSIFGADAVGDAYFACVLIKGIAHCTDYFSVIF